MPVEDGGDERVEEKQSRAHYDVGVSNVRSARLIALCTLESSKVEGAIRQL